MGEGGGSYRACVVADLKLGHYTTQEAAAWAAGWHKSQRYIRRTLSPSLVVSTDFYLSSPAPTRKKRPPRKAAATKATKRKGPDPRNGAFCEFNPAATYVPTQLPVQYHRPSEA